MIFGDTTVDGGAEGSMQAVADALRDALGAKAFLARSGRAKLREFPGSDAPSQPARRGAAGRGKDPAYLSQEQRDLIGFAGELAAYEYLKKRVRNFADEHVHLVATIGENMTIRRIAVINVPGGVAASYVHGALKPGLGKIGVIVGLSGKADEAIEALGRQIGMHVAATRPDALTIAEVDPAALEREKNVLSDQARASGKKEEIIAKMVEGRIKKFYEDVVLLEQVWVHDGESKVKAVVEKAGASITRFVRFHLGEGIEKETSDFAAEVAAAAGVKPKDGEPEKV